MYDELRREVESLRAEVSALREQIGTTGMRLGPQKETQAYIDAKTKRLIEHVETVMAVNASTPALCTTNGKPVSEVRASQTNETGQHDGYIVLCPDERAKGFVRPYRDAYQHVGRTEDVVRNDDVTTAVRVTQKRVGGCGVVTRMGRDLSETYARDPKFYSHTFCVHCNKHLPVSEFVWTSDGVQLGE